MTFDVEEEGGREGWRRQVCSSPAARTKDVGTLRKITMRTACHHHHTHTLRNRRQYIGKRDINEQQKEDVAEENVRRQNGTTAAGIVGKGQCAVLGK